MSSTRSDCVQNEFRVAEHCLDGSPVKPCEGDGIEGSDVQCDTSGAATGAGADKEVGAVAVAELRAQVAAARAELVAERRRSDEAQLKSQGEVAELREQLSERNAVVAALVKERNRQDRRIEKLLRQVRRQHDSSATLADVRDSLDTVGQRLYRTAVEIELRRDAGCGKPSFPKRADVPDFSREAVTPMASCQIATQLDVPVGGLEAVSSLACVVESSSRVGAHLTQCCRDSACRTQISHSLADVEAQLSSLQPREFGE